VKSAWKIGEFAGVGVYIHWTFGILVAFVAAQAWASSEGNSAAIAAAVGMLLAVFACVLLHEFGHSFAARRYGIQTKDITLLPIGGLARLERMPEQPWQEFVVAIAGPAVNVVIAVAIGAVLYARGDFADFLAAPQEAREGLLPIPTAPSLQQFLLQLLVINVYLVLFNLLPAFPMDGGRVLRAALAVFLPYPRATEIAAGVGQVMALVFGMLGVMLGPNWMLLIIALFIYVAGQAEAQMVQTRAAFSGITARQAMITRYCTLPPDAPLSAAVESLLAGYQTDFPVVEGGTLVGVLTRTDLIRALAEAGPNSPVSAAMRQDNVVVEESAPLETVFASMQTGDCPTLPVVRDGVLIGLLTLDNLGEWIMVRRALANWPDAPPPTSGTRGTRPTIWRTGERRVIVR